MTSELPTSADALLAERARLEEVLQSSEDWCELLRLKSRKDRGEGMSAVNAARLEMVLIDALAEDQDFIRYKAVCVALERLIRGLPPLPAKGEKPPVEKDDLTEIEGITASMQRRLNALDVTTFMQIAEWTPADVKSISADLGIGRQIYEQDWIGQAEELATRSDEPPPPPPAPKYVAPQRSAPPPPPRPVETRQPQVERAPAPPPPPVMREVPRPVEVKPAEVKPAPQPPSVVQKFEPAAPPKAELPLMRDKAPADVVQAKPEPKVDAKSDAPQPASVVKTDAPKAEASSGAPAKIASLAELSRLVKTSADDSNSGRVAKDDASAGLLPMPPSPLRVQVAPAAPASQQSSDFKPVVPASTPVALRAPPRPFVITRGSLPKIEPKAEPKLDAKPEAKTEKPAAPPLPPRMPDEAAKPAVAAPMSSAGGPSAPSMSIAEAIAYAAEVARQGPKTQQQPVKPGAPTEPPRNAPPPANGAALTSPPKAEPPRAAPPPPPPKPVVKAAPPAPAIPPPLPADFVPPPDENADADAAYAQGARAPSSRGADRDDRSDFRAHTEEATVEIVIKSAPEVVATPRAALTKVAAEASANPPRPATPIGRFLKALTGN